jgi:hypothetical protein
MGMPTGLPVLGNYAHSLDAVEFVEVAGPAAGFDTPRDLAFNPDQPSELWVINHGDHSVVVLADTMGVNQLAERFWSPDGEHFMAKPSSLAMGQYGRFASIHESAAPTQSGSTPGTFMGPTLWTTNRNVFDAGHAGHYDMLHNSPNGMGIAWEVGNVYWVFDGYHGSLTRYDFADDHGGGGSNHSDGEIVRYAEGEVSRVAGVPSHMELVGNNLYVADTGNNRVAVLDIGSGSKGSSFGPNNDGVTQYRMNGATVTTLIDGATEGLTHPSGLAIDGEVVFITDNATATIYGFSLDGQLLDWLDVELPNGALMGIDIDGSGNIFMVDATGNRVLRLSPKGSAP